MTNPAKKSRARFIAANALIYASGALLTASAAAKVAQIPVILENFRVLGYEGSRLTSIALLELACAVLFMIPRTRSLGLLLVSAYLGGAIAVHVGHAQWGAVRPAIFLGVIWLGAWLRHPQILWSFRDSISGARKLPDPHRTDLISQEG